MSALQAIFDPARRKTDGVAPLLALFVVPMLTVVVIVALISSGTSWALLAAAIAAVVVLLAIVMFGITHLLADDKD